MGKTSFVGRPKRLVVEKEGRKLIHQLRCYIVVKSGNLFPQVLLELSLWLSPIRMNVFDINNLRKKEKKRKKKKRST